MSPQTAIPIKASTQEHLSIEDIIDDIVILKDGSCSLAMQVTAINFGLLSESEQDAIIFAYAGLLNSLTFSIQIIVRSVRKDISDYLRRVRDQEHRQKNPLLLEQLRKYRQFIEHTVKDNEILDKKFYVVVPFSALELGLSSSVMDGFKRRRKLPYPKAYILEKAKMSLYPKRDHVVRQFGRIGLQSRQLNTQQLMELFYSLYNEDSVGQQFVNSKDYTTPMVQPAIGKREPLPNAVRFQQPPINPQGTAMPAPQFPSSQHATYQGAVQPGRQQARVAVPSITTFHAPNNSSPTQLSEPATLYKRPHYNPSPEPNQSSPIPPTP